MSCWYGSPMDNKEERIMAIEKFCICDVCKKIIRKEKNGVRIKGNIYTANPNIYKGIIGNNFLDTRNGENFCFDEIPEAVYCIDCFIKVIRG